jgi:nicotinate-nucleotide--dimethylbenzimidazole phosphoribosyltransferase
MNRHELEQKLSMIPPLDECARSRTQKRLDSMAKPLGSLGKFEDLFLQISALTGTDDIRFKQKELYVFCADNGIVEEGVTQSPQEVTALLCRNLVAGNTCVSRMAKRSNTTIFPVDVGLACLEKIPGMLDYRVADGTKNFMHQPAMTNEECLMAIEVGIKLAKDAKRRGVSILATGELGIGNTTTSSAVSCALLGRSPVVMTGRGAGLSSEGLRRKIEVITSALERYSLEPNDPLYILQTVGGFDLAAMVGLFLGARLVQIPVLMDGLISCTAALVAVRMCPACADALIPSHGSAEPASEAILCALGKSPILQAEMRVGEGTGCMAMLLLLEMMEDLYQNMSSFEDIHLKAYEHLV